MIWGTIAFVISVVTAAASAVQSRKAAKEQAKQQQEAAAVQVSGHDNNRSLYRVYGKALVGSTIVWKQLSHKQIPMNQTGFTRFSQWTHTGGEINGTRGKRNLYRAAALCTGPIEGVVSVKIDKTDYTDERFTVRNTNHFDACVSTGELTGTNFPKFAASGDTVLHEWDTAKVGKGVVMAYENLYLNGKSPAYQGSPQTTYEVKGMKVYDPRLDTTVSGGSGSHRHATPSTWAYSNNNALALLDYLTNADDGKGIAITEVDIQSFMDAADACEVQVAIPAKPTNDTGASRTYRIPFLGTTVTIPAGQPLTFYRPEQLSDSATTQNRFSLNIALDLKLPVLDNINTLLETFKANLLYVNGKYKVVSDDVRSPVMSLTDDDIEGSIKVSSGDRSQRLNKVTVEFTNANKGHVTDTVSWPKVTDSIYTTYLNEDNQEALHTSMDIPGCTDYYQAEDMAEYFVRESRNTLTASLTCHPRALVLHPGDVIDITTDAAGWVSKYFIVTAVNCDLTNMKTQLQLKEYDSSVYTWNAARGNEPTGYSFDVGTLNDAPAAPASFSAASTLKTNADGSTYPIITASWTEIPHEVLSLELLWAEDGDTDWNSVMINQPDTQTSTSFPVPSAGQLYDLRIRYRVMTSDGLFIESDEATTTVTTAGVSATKLALIEELAQANQANGTNLMPVGLDTFGTQHGSVLNTSYTYGAGAGSAALSPVQYRQDGQSLAFNHDDTAVSSDYLFLSPQTYVYNIPVEAGKKYIYSMSIYPTATPSWLRLYVRTANGNYQTETVSGDTWKHFTSLTANTWQRIHGVFEIEAGQELANVSVWSLDSTPSAITFYIDEVMFEEYTGNGADPQPSTFARVGGTNGAQAGAGIFNEAGDLLSDIDVANDKLVGSLMGTTLISNPSLDSLRAPTDPSNTNNRPVGWYFRGNAESEMNADGDTVTITYSSGGAWPIFTSSAWRVNPGTEYEITVVASSSASDTISFTVYDTDEEISDYGAYAIADGGDVTFTDPEIFNDTDAGNTTSVRAAVLRNDTLTTSLVAYTATWTPAYDSKYASIAIYGATGTTFTIDSVWVRDTSTYGASAGTNLFDDDGNVILPGQLISTNDGANGAFVDWAGTYPDNWNPWIVPAGSVTKEQTPLYVKVGSNSVRMTPSSTSCGITRNITGELPNSSVVVGSCDMYIVSNTSGGAPGVLVDLVDATSLYYRQAAIADPAVVGRWQTVWFTVSKDVYATKSPGTPPGAYKHIRIYLMGSYAGSGMSNWTGDVIFDNLKFHTFDTAMLGAKAGSTVFNEAGTVLKDIDLRNDQLVTSALAGINFNPSMSIPRTHASGLAPAGWFNGNTSANLPAYLDDTARDTLVVTQTRVVCGTAVRVNPDTEYEVSALVRAASGTTTVAIRAEYTTNELAVGETFVSQALGEAGSATRTGLATLGSKSTVGTTYEVLAYDYAPAAGVKWFSPSLYDNGVASGSIYVDWLVVREKSTKGATWGDDVANQPADDDILNSALRPYGAVYWVSTDTSAVYTDTVEKCGALYSSFDNEVAMSFPAFPVNSGSTDGAMQISIALKTSLTSGSRSNGLYIRVSELDSALPEGSTHLVSTTVNAHPDCTTHSRYGTISPTFENTSTTAGWKVYTFTYTPTSTAVAASLVVFNWSALGNGVETMWFKEPEIRPVVNIDVSMVADVKQTRFLSLDGGSTYQPTSTTQDVEIQAISSGSESATYTWTRSGGNVASGSLSGSGFTASTFGSAAATKTITITHTASGEAVSFSCEIIEENIGADGK